MKLSVLINGVNPYPVISGGMVNGDNPEIAGICYRSDQVSPGFIFVAVKGSTTDGHDFIEDAVSRGAAAVVVEKPVKTAAVVIQVSDTRRALALMADTFYGSPSSRLTLVGITGTNGKTTTACLLEHLLKENGFKTGVIGTIDCHFNDVILPSALTTPEATDIQAKLAMMADAGVTHVIMEVSSHGIVQKRILGCRFTAGVFTNITQDHLDFHGNMEMYRAAKVSFFTDYLDNQSTAVINRDTADGEELADVLKNVKKKITVGNHPACDVRAENLLFDQSGVFGRISLPSGAFDFHSPLVGRFNMENILCAAGTAFALGVSAETINNAIPTFSRVPGRLEKVINNSSRHVFVDYSHTPDALENVLTSLKSVLPGRLICIFGCGGDRDKGKRPLMGKIAATLADIVIVTSDNPRSEPPGSIIEDILIGVRQTGKTEMAADQLYTGPKKNVFTVLSDRSQAINLGIGISLADDGILIAGKGHETYQLIGREILSFDDRLQAKKALAEHGMQ